MFSTLWVFGNLWWLPLADAIVILVLGWVVLRRRFYRVTAGVLGVAFGLSWIIAGGLFAVGKATLTGVRISYQRSGCMVVTCAAKPSGRVLIFPESSVLGDAWGKEIRRLAAAKQFRDLEIWSMSRASEEFSFEGPQWILACGDRSAAGFAALRKCPEATLVLIHPTGKPVIPADLVGRVSVMLPLLDTRNAGLAWKKVCKKMGWSISTTQGVGQDIRAVWPGVLKPF